MNFIQIDKPKNTNTPYFSAYSTSSISGGVAQLKYLELTEIQKNIKSGVIKKTIESSGGFGTVTSGTPIYLIDDSGFIFTQLNASGTNTNIASIDVNGVINSKEIRLYNGANNVTLKLDDNGNLCVDKTLISEGDLVSFSDGSATGGTGGSGGLIQTVYGLSGLGGSFLNTDLTSTFNAYTINQLNNKIITLEGGSATSINVIGSGNAITTISKNGTVITVNKGSSFSLDSHNHLLNNLTEKSYNSLTDKPTQLSQFTNNLGNYGEFLTGINSSQVVSALGFTPYNNTNPSGYASTGYVNQKIFDLIGGAPASLDTLKEIATSLNNNANLSSTLINSIALKANQSNEGVYDLTIDQYTTADVHLAAIADSSAYSINSGNTDLFDGIDSDKFIYGDNASGYKVYSNLDVNNIYKAGFYALYNAANAPMLGDMGLLSIPA